MFPSLNGLRDGLYVEAHINNLYNTTFWALVQQGGQTTTEAHSTLRVPTFLLPSHCAILISCKGTFAKDKHEILFSRFGINYNQLDARFRKGSVLVREDLEEEKEGEVCILARLSIVSG